MANNTAQQISAKLSKLKAAIYIRVSTVYQVDKDSLQVQRRELIAYCEMVLGITDYEIFEDAGYSAKNTDRPDYLRMMDRLRTGEFSHLLVWKIDRISRNLLDFSAMYQELKSLGINFVSKNEQFDTSNAISEAMLKIILVFAELERNMTSERVTAVMLSRATNGQWNGGRVPFGYDYSKDTQKFTINEAQAKVVQMIADMYEQYQSLLYVSRQLNEAGYKTRAGNKWTPTAVYTILSNPFYKGCYLYNVHDAGNRSAVKDKSEWLVFEDHHPAILSEIQFDRISLSLKRNRRGGVKKEEARINKNIHIFAGKVHCGQCGNLMSATLDRRRANGYRPSIYGCSGRRATRTCQNKYISDLRLVPFVFGYIANIIRAKDEVAAGMTIDKLEQRLLTGDAFFGIDHIEVEGLTQIYDLLRSGKTGLEYEPPQTYPLQDDSETEYSLLQNRKQKAERALNRLQTLYLYSDEPLPEKDYIISRTQLVEELQQIEGRLKKFDIAESNNAKVNDEFLAKASYFIMVEKLLDADIDYEEYIQSADLEIPRNFVLATIENIIVSDGNVQSIVFKNGITHNFIYK